MFEKGHVTILVALDLSAAFNAIDHTVIIRRLEHFDDTGSALNWVCSYVDRWSDFMQLGGILTNIIELDIGIPQGSSLGPQLFLFITALGDLISRFVLKFHQYADDTQIHITNNGSCLETATSNLTSWNSAIYDRFLHNSLSTGTTLSRPSSDRRHE